MSKVNLKSKTINRIILDMIETVKQKEVDSPFLMLVVDDFTVKLLSFYLTMSDILNRGIFNVEPLKLKRKPYPNYSVIYFVSPTKESVEKIVEDFSPGNPTYGNVHIYFSSRLLDTTLNLLVNGELAYRIKSLKELNVSFFSKENSFDFRLENSLQTLALSSSNYSTERRNKLNQIKDYLLTMIVSMKEFPYIQYQQSKHCSELASMLHASLHEMNDLKLLNSERKSICLILDRSVDMITPVLHDYSYKAIIYDFFNIDIDGNLKIESENINDYKLDEKDEFWMKYRNSHIGEVLKNIQLDVDEFKKSDLAKGSNANLENFEDMIKAVQDVKGYREKHKQLDVHLKICNKIIKVSNLLNEFTIISIIT